MIRSIYIAARYTWRKGLDTICSEFTALGIEVTSRWIRGECEGISNIQAAEIDLEDVDRADALVLLSANGEGVGRHIEFGYAMGKGKPLFILNARESVFHHLPRVTVRATVSELVKALREYNFKAGQKL